MLRPVEILRIRGSLGLDQVQFGLLLDVPNTLVSQWEDDDAGIKPTPRQEDLLHTIRAGARNHLVIDDMLRYLDAHLPAYALGVILGAAVTETRIDHTETRIDQTRPKAQAIVRKNLAKLAKHRSRGVDRVRPRKVRK